MQYADDDFTSYKVYKLLDEEFYDVNCDADRLIGKESPNCVCFCLCFDLCSILREAP